MNEEVKETILKLSDYAEAINQKIKVRFRPIGRIGIGGYEIYESNPPFSQRNGQISLVNK